MHLPVGSCRVVSDSTLEFRSDMSRFLVCDPSELLASRGTLAAHMTPTNKVSSLSIAGKHYRVKAILHEGRHVVVDRPVIAATPPLRPGIPQVQLKVAGMDPPARSPAAARALARATCPSVVNPAACPSPEERTMRSCVVARVPTNDALLRPTALASHPYLPLLFVAQESGVCSVMSAEDLP
jgi:hypothetical protein